VDPPVEARLPHPCGRRPRIERAGAQVPKVIVIGPGADGRA
jgi:hypothetical protein